jgi:sulfonate transport system permease protein
LIAAAIRMLHRHGISLAVLFAMVVAWQALSVIYRAEALPGEPMVPGWQIVFTRTLVSLSDYWRGGLGVKAVADGAERSAIGGVLSILDASLDTIVRLYTGLAIGALFGGLCGLAVSWSNWSRRLVALPLHLIRTLPLLAMVPLFQLWFGTYFVGKIIFVAYGVGVIFFVGVANAVRNVPQIYIDNALALGATRWRLYRTVILPAIFPELRSTILLSLGTGWGATLGAEYLGAQSGLGYIIVYSEQFAYLDRMFLIALVIVVYACVSYAVFNHIALKALAWMPRGGTDVVVG